ncbi:MAG: DUF4924 domain-containing protein [Marinilabiliales bacterium]|nr:MAG: DUF4924 domain-containing protein [Marinilabiliales bacterium]
MIVAKQKKEENIAEYILYMWQIEDLIRAYKLDIGEINKNIVEKFNQPNHIKTEISNWYSGLIDLMIEEGKKETGHLQFIQNTVNDLNQLHLQLLKSPEHLDYIEAYNKAKEGIVELMNKSKGTVENEMEACFNGLYGILMLRLQKRTINLETATAITAVSQLIALNSKKYKLLEEGKIEF